MTGMTIPSIGDVLMLSQTSWKIGRNFASDKKQAPEFVEIATELNRLTKALKRLAESFFEDGTESFVSLTDQYSQDGIAVILLSCRRTLDDLESLTDQYQVVKRTKTAGGYTIERSWSNLVLSNINGMIWTAKGHNILILKEIIAMHSITVSMVKSVLDRKSHTDLDMCITPVAEKIQAIYEGDIENLSEHLAEIRGLATATGAEYPSPTSGSPISRVESIAKRMSGFSLPSGASSPDIRKDPERRPAAPPTPIRTPEMLAMDSLKALQYSPGFQDAAAKLNPILLPLRIDSLQPKVDQAPPHSHPHLQSLPPASLRRAVTTSHLPSGPADQEPKEESLPKRPASDVELIRLPPPAWDEETASLNKTQPLSLMPTIQPEAIKLTRSTSTISQKAAFDRRLFQNSAILCDLRCTLVEYVEGENMEEAMKEGRICLVRRKHTNLNGQIGYSTSIWSFSDDLNVRLQQDLEDGQDIIPYTSFFQNEKVSLTFPTNLRFHNVALEKRPLKTVQTGWLNYYFTDEDSSREFQNQLFNRTLMGIYKTEKTTRVHEGFHSVLAYQEQMCGIENLRIWHEEDTAGVLAMLHYSAIFRTGYLTFYLNNALQPVRVRDEGGKLIKIKGLKIPIAEKEHRMMGTKERRASSHDSKKMITAVRIEFTNEAEKNAFIEQTKEAQTKMVDIEDG